MSPIPRYSIDHVEVAPVLDENNLPIFVRTEDGFRPVTRAEWEAMEAEWEVVEDRQEEQWEDPDFQYPFDDPDDPIESTRWGFTLPQE